MDRTLQKLADELGLSVMSVSRALQGRGGVSESTRQRVKAAADAAEYRPNLIARALLTGRTDNVGIVASNFADYNTAVLFGALELNLRQAGLQALPHAYGDDEPQRSEVVSRLAAQRVDGLLIVGAERSTAAGIVKSAVAAQIPVVYICLEDADPLESQQSLIDELICGKVEVVASATHHLLGADRKKLLLVANGDEAERALIVAQFGDADNSANVSIGSRSILSGVATMRQADMAVSELINADRRAFDAILATTDRLAVGAIRACQRAGLTIGRRFQDDISLICASDSPLCVAFEPSITAYEIAADEVARLCVERLTARIKSPTKLSPERFVIPARLLRRESA